MADLLLTKNHIVHSIEDERGNRDIFYSQNTLQDVLIDEDATEDIRGHVTYYGTCGTADNDSHKTVSVVDGKVNILRNGVQLNITFVNGNTVAPITLSVNGGPEYLIEGVMETSVVVNQTLILIFTGSSFIIGGASGVPVETEGVIGQTPDRTRYLTFVEGETGNADFKIDKNVKITKDGLATEVGNSTVNFSVDNPTLVTDVRSTHTPAPKESLKTILKKVRHIIDALGKLAFKDSVGTSELNQQLKDHYNLTVHKSGKINGSSVNDLYNGTDYNSTVGVKALDAKVGKTLQDQITSLNSKMTSSTSTTKNGHTHNDIYYTETEIDAKLKTINANITKLNSTGTDNANTQKNAHTHDDRYYTETEINTKLTTINTNITKLNSKGTNNENTQKNAHNHDDRYYTETEMNAKIKALQDSIDSVKKRADLVLGGNSLTIFPSTTVDDNGNKTVSAENSTKTLLWQTVNKIPVDAIETITATCAGSAHPLMSGSGGWSGPGTCTAVLFISNSSNPAPSNATKKSTVSWSAEDSNKSATIDVSGVTGSYFVCVHMTVFGGWTKNTAGRTWLSTSTLTIKKISAALS